MHAHSRHEGDEKKNRVKHSVTRSPSNMRSRIKRAHWVISVCGYYACHRNSLGTKTIIIFLGSVCLCVEKRSLVSAYALNAHHRCGKNMYTSENSFETIKQIVFLCEELFHLGLRTVFRGWIMILRKRSPNPE